MIKMGNYHYSTLMRLLSRLKEEKALRRRVDSLKKEYLKAKSRLDPSH
jgi:hypothetical protein